MFVRTYRHAYVATFEDEGAVGLVLNRPTQADLLDHLPGWCSSAVRSGKDGDRSGQRGSASLEGWPKILWIRAVDPESAPGEDFSIDSPRDCTTLKGGWGMKRVVPSPGRSLLLREGSTTISAAARSLQVVYLAKGPSRSVHTH